MPHKGYGGKQFQSSVLAKASFPSLTRGVTSLTGSTYETGYRPPEYGTRGGVSGGGRGRLDYSALISGFQEREEKARAANIRREKEIRGIYGGIIGQYEEGGAFKKAGLADIERTKTRAVGAGTQQMISSGMYGTTTAAAIPVQAEAQAGRARLKLEDILEQRTTEAKLGLAGFAERIETPYPDYNMLMQAMIAQGQR